MASISRFSLPLLALALVAGPLSAQTHPVAPQLLASLKAQEGQRFLNATSHIHELRGALGLDSQHTFLLTGGHTDELGQTHARFQQHFQGIPVLGGDAITHTDAQGTQLPITHTAKTAILINTTPNLAAGEALAVAHQDMAPKGAYARTPSSELVIFPVTTAVPRVHSVRAEHLDATMMDTQVVRYALAYRVSLALENDQETRHMIYIVDAHTGTIIQKWNDLHTSAATGTGHSQWYGTVPLNTNSVTSGYELRDMTRGTGGTYGNNATMNLNHATSGNGTIFTDADNAWGDGNAYPSGSGTSTTGATGQTAAADAHHGMAATWDFYKNVLGRNGIDNTGKASYGRVHYSTSYDNAFWDDSCFCMTYGDGNPPSGSYGEADLDTVGHEMSHGVCAATANLTYSGESGGLNESNSDIFGTAVEFYTLGANGTGSVVPDSPGTGTITANYTMFENSWGHPGQALRYMYKPSLDGSSPDAWSSTTGGLDVHYSSGPMNRCWYFLARGATTSGDTSTTYLPSGMTGVGNDHATRIWYRALTTYLTSSSNYAAARTAAISAAKDLYGAGGADEAAVWNAFHGINVGAAWTGTAALAITTQPANKSVTAGSSVTFTVAVSGGTSPYTYQWYKNGTAVSGATAASYTFTTATTDNAATFYVKVTDSAATKATVTSSTATLTVTAPAALAITTNPASQTVTAGSNASFTVAATGGTAPYTYQWYKNGTAVSGATAATYTFTTAVADSGSTFYAKVTDSASTPASATSTTATLTVNPISTTQFTEVESNNTIATANVVAPTFTSILGNLPTTTDVDYFALTLAAGQKLTLNMTGPTGPDWDLYLKNSAGTTLASSTGSTTTESVTYTNTGTSPITVYANVTCYATASTSNYTLVPTYSAVTQTVAVAITPTSTTVNPGATAQFTATVTGTTNTAVTWTTTGGTISTSGLFTAPTTSGTYTVKATSVADTTKSASATVTVGTVSTTYNEVESNNTIATANAVPATATKIVGYIGSSTDADYYAVTVAGTRTLAVGMTGPTGSTYDYDLYIYNAAGTQLAASEGSTTTENVSYTNSGSAAVTYYIAVKRYAGSSTTTPYNLTVSR